ncbi:MAG: extensin family protein [Pseudomonadota bacterium]
MPRLRPLLAALCSCLVSSFEARAANPYLEIPPEAEVRASPAHTYANMTNAEAFAELDRRGVAYEHATPPRPGVRAPIRLRGPLHGVHIHSSLPRSEWATTPYEILDARLALVLDDFCALLARHDIVEIVHFTMYRMPTEHSPDPEAPQIRHPGGMAIDVGALRKRNGQWLSIGPQWPPAIGARTCGPGARAMPSRSARELVSIVCEAADLRLFHFMLTPHFDDAHADHLHLEIKPGSRWFLVN